MEVVPIDESFPGILKLSWHEGPVEDCCELTLKGFMEVVQVREVFPVLLHNVPAAQLVYCVLEKFWYHQSHCRALVW